MRSKKISIFTFILVIVLSFTNTMTAFAGGRSDERTITLKGYTYRFWSVINNPSTGEIFAQTTLDVVDKEAPFLNQMGIEPELILAEGNDGIIGYVRAEDLETDNVQTLDEAIAYMDNRTLSYRIPLYASDGKTVIGAFTIG
ncbi:MAG: hypothetical protein HDT30_01510 [Clostridiales bacterium]|nr:hypothetical protein [Clostridiales bacterium]